MYDPRSANSSLYLANKMSGIPFFNAPWFDAAAIAVRALPTVSGVFNPSEHDRKMGFDPMSCPTGSLEEARVAGFVSRKVLGEDWAWIARYSDGLVIGPQWRDSPGTISEIACHQALRLPVWEYGIFMSAWADEDLFSRAIPPIMEVAAASLVK